MRHVLTAAIFYCLLANSASAVIILVPGDYSTIQGAIDVSSSGDSIVVFNGTYCENLVITNKNITIQSVNGAGRTVIDGGQNNPCLRINSTTATGLTTLNGFTLTNGMGYNTGDPVVRYKGAGIYADQSTDSLEVLNCVFHDNKYTNYQTYGNEGISIWYYASYGESIKVEGCEFYDEDFPATALRANCAVAIYSDFDGDAYFIDNTVHDCDENINAVVNIYGLEYTEVDDNVFYGNNGGCPPLSVRVCDEGYIRNNVFYDNDCNNFSTYYGGTGGAMWLAAASNTTDLHVLNNTMFDNYAYFKGGAIYCSFLGDGTIEMHNNICWENETYQSPVGDGSEIHLAFFLGGGTAEVTYCDVEDGEDGIVISGTGTYNIDDIYDWDPSFVSEARYNLHLSTSSRLIDLGKNDFTGEPEYDFEGDDRVIDGDGDNVAIIDMGADEVRVNE